MTSQRRWRFAAEYYEDADDGYVSDYSKTFTKEASIYHVQDTPENFAKIRKKLDARFDAWLKKA